MESQSTLEKVVRTIVDSFTPLSEALSQQDSELFALLMERFGILLNEETISINEVKKLFAVIETLEGIKTSLSCIAEAEGPRTIQLLANVVDESSRFLEEFQNLRDNPNLKSLPPILNNEYFKNEVLPGLFEHLLITYLESNSPTMVGLLYFIGALEIEYVQGGDLDGTRLDHMIKRINWDRILDIISRPTQFLSADFRWGEGPDTFDGDLFLTRIEKTVLSLDISASRYPPNFNLLSKYYLPYEPNEKIPLLLKISFLEEYDEALDTFVDASILIMPIPPQVQPDNKSSGIVIVPQIIGRKDTDIAFSSNSRICFAGGMESGVGIEIRPGRVELKTNLLSESDSSSVGSLDASIKLLISTNNPFVVLSDSQGTRLEVDEIAMALLLEGTSPQDAEIILQTTLDNASIVLSGNSVDGFIKSILPQNATPIVFDLTFGWSSRNGFFIKGGVDLTYKFTLNKSIGPVLVTSIDLGLLIYNKALCLAVTVSGRVKIGPLAIVVENFGLELTLNTESGGLLGNTNISLGFKPPAQFGLNVSASGIRGGGYLSIDPEKGEYTGILDLSIQNKLSLKAFGILTASKPGQPADFSLYLLITAEFTAIQLGYGFRLTGIGGMLGINRTMALEALQAGVKTGAVDSILFPQNPIANAPVILSNIRNFFPLAEGRFILGLMVRIDWGGVSLIELKVGVIIELTDPPNIILMGQLAVTMPSKDNLLVDLKLDFLGWLYPDRCELGLDGTLRDSRLLGYPVSGDMLMRLRWGDQPVFILALGGFHPRFVPPPGLPTMERLAINLCSGDNPRIRLAAYLAITSNTLQFGAQLDVYAEKDLGWIGNFSVQAYLTFDTLIRFQPFYFLIAIEGHASLRRNGKAMLAVGLSLNLEGPRPWHAWGKARFDLGGFIKGQVSFNVSFGSPKDDSGRVTADPQALLLTELQDTSNWTSQLPVGESAAIKFREPLPTEANKELVLNPMGRIAFRQSVVPLGQRITKFGEAKPENQGPFVIESIYCGDQLLKLQDTREYFAAAQFFELSESEKLSRPSFEQYPCGKMVELGQEDNKSTFGGAYTETELHYREMAFFRGQKIPEEPSVQLQKDALVGLLALGAAGQSSLRRFVGASQVVDQRVTVSDDHFIVAKEGSLASDKKLSETTKYQTYVEARQAMIDAELSEPRVFGAHEFTFQDE